MERIFKSHTRVYVIIAVLLAILAWGRIAVMGFINPSPLREMKVARPEHVFNTDFSCDQTSISVGQYLYRTGCVRAVVSYIVRLDMANGLLDAWPLPEPIAYGRSNDLVEFKTEAGGTVDMRFAADPQAGREEWVYRLLPGGQTAKVHPPEGQLPAPPLTGPTGEPVSTDRLAREKTGERWLEFRKFLYTVDSLGQLRAAEVRTGHVNPSSVDGLRPGLTQYNLVPLGDRWALVELRASQGPGSPGSLVVIDDQTGATTGVVPVILSPIAFNFILAAPDTDGGLWVLGPLQSYAHFDSTLRRTDPLTIPERFTRMEVDNFRLWNENPVWWTSDPGSVYNLSLIPLKQAAVPVLLLGLPIGVLAAMWVQRRRTTALPQPFLGSPELRRAAQVYIGLFVLFIYWYWSLTAFF